MKSDHADAARAALAAHGIEAPTLEPIPGSTRVLSDFATVVVKLHSAYDAAWQEVYWARILGDGGASVAPLLITEVVPVLDQCGVVTRYLDPDRETDERDAAAAAGRVMTYIHDLAFEYAETDGVAWTPHDSQPCNFVLHEGALYLVDLDNVERHDRASARRGAASDFASGLRADVRESAYERFLAAYDS